MYFLTGGRNIVSKLQHFQKYKLRYEIAFLCIYFFINNSLIATSVVMEAQRKSGELPFALWEPFLWEYSSAIAALLLFPLIVLLLDKLPFNWQAIRRYISIYLLSSIVFSISHTGIMVSIRELVYGVQSLNYDFGDLWFELLYEYRKDLWSFIFFVIAIHAYRFILSRLQGRQIPLRKGRVGTTTCPLLPLSVCW